MNWAQIVTQDGKLDPHSVSEWIGLAHFDIDGCMVPVPEYRHVWDGQVCFFIIFDGGWARVL